jgi:hypothetical protein
MTTTTDTSANRTVSSTTDAAVLGGVGEILQPDQVSEFVAAAIAGAGIENKRVCLVVPDATRTCPLPLLLQAMREGLAMASQVTVVIALGTHQSMSEEHLGRHLGYQPDAPPAGTSAITSSGFPKPSPPWARSVPTGSPSSLVGC